MTAGGKNSPPDRLRLSDKPFYLTGDKLAWVEATLSRMSLEEKVGQLFCVMIEQADQREVDAIYSVLRPGACMYRVLSFEKIQRVQPLLKAKARGGIPPFIAANLEKGGNGIVEEGTLLGSPMQVAATDDVEFARKLGVVCAEEARAAGCQVAFSPIVDIDFDYHNPITNTRTFGSDPDRVRRMGIEYIRAMQERGMAACVKHFPGDGQDERDQHLVTSVNMLSCEQWDASYGRVYRACIDAGVMCCMAGHIMLPAYSRRLRPGIADAEILPGSLAPEILGGLLRERLGFNGLILTDASTMAGFTIPMPREKAVPACIAAGADMFLFSRNLEEDYRAMLGGVERGILSMERLNEAVARILALKAALNIGEMEDFDRERARRLVGSARHRQWARECADRAITLVKEEKGVLPLSPRKYRRVLFYSIEAPGGAGRYKTEPQCEKLRKRLEAEGFEVDEFVPEPFVEGQMAPMAEMKQYDLIIYAANLMTKSNQTTVRIQWSEPMGCNCPHYLNSVPTIFISLENPYHLLDVPRVKTYINTYSAHDANIEMLVEKLMGRSAFKGMSPVDPFCGKWDARL